MPSVTLSAAATRRLRGDAFASGVRVIRLAASAAPPAVCRKARREIGSVAMLSPPGNRDSRFAAPRHKIGFRHALSLRGFLGLMRSWRRQRKRRTFLAEGEAYG